MSAPATDADVGELYSRILGNPGPNLDKAITTFVQEFETKRTSLAIKDDITLRSLQESPTLLKESKEALQAGLEGVASQATTTLERLQLLKRSVVPTSQNTIKPVNPADVAKEAFLKDIAKAKEAFDQEMALRHADVVKQYVGACIDLF